MTKAKISRRWFLGNALAALVAPPVKIPLESAIVSVPEAAEVIETGVLGGVSEEFAGNFIFSFITAMRGFATAFSVNPVSGNYDFGLDLGRIGGAKDTDLISLDTVFFDERYGSEFITDYIQRAATLLTTQYCSTEVLDILKRSLTDPGLIESCGNTDVQDVTFEIDPLTDSEKLLFTHFSNTGDFFGALDYLTTTVLDLISKNRSVSSEAKIVPQELSFWAPDLSLDTLMIRGIGGPSTPILTRHDLHFLVELEFYESNSFIANKLSVTAEQKVFLDLLSNHPFTKLRQAVWHDDGEGLGSFNRVLPELQGSSQYYEAASRLMRFSDNHWNPYNHTANFYSLDINFLERTADQKPEKFVSTLIQKMRTMDRREKRKILKSLHVEALPNMYDDKSLEGQPDMGYVALYRVTPNNPKVSFDANTLRAVFGRAVSVIGYLDGGQSALLGVSHDTPKAVVKKLDDRALGLIAR